jgi:signal transduction histidine kinase
MATVRSLPRADVALALALSAYALGEGIVLGAPAGWLVAAPLVSLAFAWRRRYPAAVVGLALSLIVLPDVLTDESVGSVLPLPLIILCGFIAGREAASAREAAIGAVAIAGVMSLSLIGNPESENSRAEDSVAFSFLVGGSAAVGHLMRVRQAENRRLHDLTEQLAAERDLKAQAAVAEERARVARELHDIVAHNVSLIAVQAGAAENLMGRDEARARESLHAVQDAARGALAEMRRLLTVLRNEDGEQGLEPQPGLRDVAGLVEQVRSGGLPVRLHEQGPRPEVPAGVDLSAYRIVQESLTNVRKHAGATATDVVVSYPPGEVVVEVVNDDTGPAATGNGHGIPGMRERVRLYGGTLEVVRADGRHVVRARLPIGGPAE